MGGAEIHQLKWRDLEFLLSLPAQQGVPVERPLLCFLHGYDEGKPTDIHMGLTRHGPLSPRSAPFAQQEFIIVAPHLPRCGDIWMLYAADVVEIIRQVQFLHGADGNRTYLTGFSFGGNGVFDLALHAPELWTALWPVDPTRVPAEDPALPVWISSGQVSRGRKEQYVRKLQLREPGQEAAGDRVYEDAGLDHVGTATAAYGNEAIYRWLLARTRG